MPSRPPPSLTFEVDTDAELLGLRGRLGAALADLGLASHDCLGISAALSELVCESYSARAELELTYEVVDATLHLSIAVQAPEGGTAPLPAAPELSLVSSWFDSSRLDSEQRRLSLLVTRPVERPHGSPPPRISDPRLLLRSENRRLLEALAEGQKRRVDLEALALELEETNRGVLALHGELEEKADALRRSHELKSRFYSEMNHEVRTPIHAILGLSKLLLSGSEGELAPQHEAPLGFIRKSAQQLSILIDDLLDLAKSEAGKMTVRAEPFLVAELFSSLRGMFRPLQENELVTLVFEDVSTLPELRTDEGKVAQILRNFVSNALKFTDAGEIRVSANLSDEALVFSVSDTGIGIDLAQHASLFQPFTQLDNDAQPRAKGTGLGLSLSRNLAELLGGSVRVQSSLGRGSTFELVFPRSAVVIEPREPRALPAQDKPLVLVIDDDPVARYLIQRALARAPYQLAEATSGYEGIERARALSPDVILLDLHLPDLPGRAVLSRLRAQPETSAIPVIIHTSSWLDERERDHLRQEAVAVLSKEEFGRAGHVELQRALAHAVADPGTRRPR